RRHRPHDLLHGRGHDPPGHAAEARAMTAQRRIDLVLDSVRRLLRVGASANLLNLLQKQHPADLAQIFSELQDKDRDTAFSILAERNGRLAMEAISELGPQ